MLQVSGEYKFRILREGHPRDEGESSNLVTDSGVAALMELAFNHGPQSNWYLGLKTEGDITGGDTLLSHAWSEYQGYSSVLRPLWSSAPDGRGQVISTGPAEFRFNAQGVVVGAFLVNTSDKGGTTGTLYSVSDFDFPRQVYAGDVMQLLYRTKVRR